MTAAMTAASRPVRRRSAEHGGIILKLIALFFVVLLVGAVWLLRAPLLRTAAEAWIVDEAPQPSDAIVLLGNDNFGADRAARAAELYRERWAPRIIASGRYVRPYATIADLMRRDLTERGVPADAILAFSNTGANTREEAYAVRSLLREKKWTRVIVVTSSYHTRRARYIWRRAAGPEMQVRVVAARDADFDPRSWWQSRQGLKLAFNECVGFAVALFEMH